LTINPEVLLDESFVLPPETISSVSPEEDIPIVPCTCSFDDRFVVPTPTKPEPVITTLVVSPSEMAISLPSGTLMTNPDLYFSVVSTACNVPLFC